MKFCDGKTLWTLVENNVITYPRLDILYVESVPPAKKKMFSII